MKEKMWFIWITIKDQIFEQLVIYNNLVLKQILKAKKNIWCNLCINPKQLQFCLTRSLIFFKKLNISFLLRNPTKYTYGLHLICTFHCSPYFTWCCLFSRQLKGGKSLMFLPCNFEDIFFLEVATGECNKLDGVSTRRVVLVLEELLLVLLLPGSWLWMTNSVVSFGTGVQY